MFYFFGLADSGLLYVCDSLSSFLSDRRVNLLAEMVQGVQIIKILGCERESYDKIDELRQVCQSDPVPI